jgi:outer membrane protein assembly factor BamB
VVLGALLALFQFGLPLIAPDAKLYSVLGGAVCALGVGVWWLFASRAPYVERFGAAALVALAMLATPRWLHVSVAQGNMGFQFYLYAIPSLGLAFVVWAVATRRLTDRTRRATMAVTILFACGVFTLFRSKGVTGEGSPEFAWRWSETAEERLLAAASHPTGTPASVPTADAASSPRSSPEHVESTPAEVGAAPESQRVSSASLADPALVPGSAPGVEESAASSPESVKPAWPGFRGPDRDGVVAGARIATDWAAAPPAELWRRPIGPGVSSFAVQGDRLYTQEQRGEEEIVACYSLSTGEPIWQHRDTGRFWDSHVGAGPRATPALGAGRVYALGAKGLLNALNAEDGALLWSRDVAAAMGAELPAWGFVSSPLLIGESVVVHVGSLVAYDRLSGELRWTGPDAGGSYASPQRLILDGVPQIVLLGHAGLIGVAPDDGNLLWQHAWPGIGMVQPALTADGDVLFSMVDNGAMPVGTRRLGVGREAGAWVAQERWTSNRLKPSFSPMVVHEGYAFGFDGRIITCIDVARGERQWKGGRYGSGQLLLLADQDLLLVVSERGELALVRALPEGFEELARFPAIEGKTWNQPALVDDILLVRNGEEMAAFRLARAAD